MTDFEAWAARANAYEKRIDEIAREIASNCDGLRTLGWCRVGAPASVIYRGERARPEFGNLP